MSRGSDIAWEGLIQGGEVRIPREHWRFLNDNLSPTEIRNLIGRAIDAGQIPFPFKALTPADALADFQRLRDSSLSITEGSWVTRREYRWGLSTRYFGFGNAGLKSSNYYHQNSRMACDGRGYPSPLRTWRTPAFRANALKALWTLGCDEVGPKQLLHAIEVRKYVASQFRPSVAKAVFDHFAPERVLDFSAGWGDRLSAALASSSVRRYTGIDPNPDLHPGYAAQIQAFNRDLDPGMFFEWFAPPFEPKEVEMVCAASEDLTFESEYDMVFTSPPYFDKERYNPTPDQSWVRYPDFESWLQGFLFQVLRKSWEALRPGGHLVINIADVTLDERLPGTSIRKRGEICDPMNDWISQFHGASYEGALGIRMASRPRPGFQSEAFCEPLWIWRKE